MTDISRAFLDQCDLDIWWRPNEASNSIGNLILHLSSTSGGRFLRQTCFGV